MGRLDLEVSVLVPGVANLSPRQTLSNTWNSTPASYPAWSVPPVAVQYVHSFIYIFYSTTPYLRILAIAWWYLGASGQLSFILSPDLLLPTLHVLSYLKILFLY